MNEREYDYLVTVQTSLPLDDVTQALAAIEVPGVEVISVQWIP